MQPTPDSLHETRAQLLQALTQVNVFRIGSIFHRQRRCGKKNCACAEPTHPGHGCWIVEKRRDGKNIMSTVPAAAVDEVKRQLEEGQRFLQLCAQFAEVNDELAIVELKQKRSAADAVQKKLWKPSSRQKSPPNSRR